MSFPVLRRQKIGTWIEIDHNKFYVHSKLGYISPEEFEGLRQGQIDLKEVA